MTSDAEFLIELQREFLDEVTFLLDQSEACYLKLEDPAARPENLGQIFRLAHSMKGAGAAVGFTDLAAFAHTVEDCLSLLRARPELVEIEIITLLLKCGDAFKIRVDQLKRKSDEPWDVEALRTEVKETTARLASATAKANADAAGAAASETPVVAAPAPTPASAAPAKPSAAIEDDFFKLAAVPLAPPPPTAQAAPTIQTAPAPAAVTPSAPLATAPITPHGAPIVAPPTQKASPPPPQDGGAKGVTSIKVDTDRIDAVLDIVGELVVLKSQLMNETEALVHNQRLGTLVSLIDKTVRELQDKTLSMRMMPLNSLFLRCQRVVRDLSLKLNKPVNFLMQGEDTEIDRTMVEQVTDPMLHMIRNSIDHGIEKKEKRLAAGKAEKGTIQLLAEQTGGRVVIRVVDDGGGINREKVIAKALERGLISQDKNITNLTNAEVTELLFMPGFSTAEIVSDVSGRGVGLDVVRTNIEKLKGTVEIDFDAGKGTTFTISLPLTTSITDGMQVLVDGHPYILPMDGIRELFNTRDVSITRLTNGEENVQLREKFLPIVKLKKLLISAHRLLIENHVKKVDAPTQEMAVVVEHGSKVFAFKVDAVLGQSQVVLKTLGAAFKKTQGIAGAAILGNGQVALVLDIDGLAKQATKVLEKDRGKRGLELTQ